MRFPISWINDFVDLKNVNLQDVVNVLNQVGFEVEEVISEAQGLDHVVVGHIISIEQHPNADRLSVCKVEIGNDKIAQILTNAKNIKVGDYVPLALSGANLPCGIKIEEGVIRGVKSQGMFCGGEEIGVTEEEYAGAGVYGILILHEAHTPGTPIAKVLGKDDTILEIGFTPNRADAMSVVGIAREIAAGLKLKFKMPKLSYKVCKGLKPDVNVEILNDSKCLRYMGACIKNVKNTKSPAWMQKRLIAAGHKPYSVLVDITNYVLHEMGQPMHAFDQSKIAGNNIVIRDAKPNETIKLLDGKDYTLSSDVLVIADSAEPMVVAGVMGGEKSGTFAETSEVFLESAIFDYASIRHTAKKLGVASSSSARFSKGVYVSSAEDGLNRALSLVGELGVGDICEGVIDKHGRLPKQKTVVSSVERINTRLALNISAKEMCSILNRLEIKSTANGGKIKSIVPLFRTDISNEEDISEEIGRSYGYDKISETNTTPTKTAFKGGELYSTSLNNKIRNLLADNGYNEILTFQFISPKMNTNYLIDNSKCIEILNPLGKDYSILRCSLMPNMLATVAQNERQKNDEYSLFEIAKCFVPKSLPLTQLPDEPVHLCMTQVGVKKDFYDIKASLDLIAQKLNLKFDYAQSADNAQFHPGICADVYFRGKKIGCVGKLHPQILENFEISGNVFGAEIDLATILSVKEKPVVAQEVSKLPFVTRDLAFVVDKNLPAGDLVKCVLNADKAQIKWAEVFDVYEGEKLGENKKSVAIKFKIWQNNVTLKEDEINAIMNKVIAFCEKNLGAKLR